MFLKLNFITLITYCFWSLFGNALNFQPVLRAQSNIDVFQLFFDNTGERFFTSSERRSAGTHHTFFYLWNTYTLTAQILPNENECRYQSLNPNGKYLVLYDCNKAHIDVLDLRSKATQLVRSIPGQEGTKTNSVAFSHDGSLLATVSSKGEVIIWRSKDLLAGGNVKPYKNWKAPEEALYGIQFSHDDKDILTYAGYSGSESRVWNIEKASEKFRLGLVDINFSPNSDNILTFNNYQKDVSVFDGASGEKVFTVDVNPRYVDKALYSPDGKYIVTISNIPDEGYKVLARFHSPLSGRTLFSLNDEVWSGISRVGFSPDGRFFAASFSKDENDDLSSSDSEEESSNITYYTKIWDLSLDDRSPIYEIQNSDEMLSIAFSPNHQDIIGFSALAKRFYVWIMPSEEIMTHQAFRKKFADSKAPVADLGLSKSIYFDIMVEYIKSDKSANYNGFIQAFDAHNKTNNIEKSSYVENIIFNSLSIGSQRYIQALIPGRPN